MPDWSPNGDEIAYVHIWGVWVMNRDGSGQFQLAGGDEDSYPAWQPLQPRRPASAAPTGAPQATTCSSAATEMTPSAAWEGTTP